MRTVLDIIKLCKGEMLMMNFSKNFKRHKCFYANYIEV